MPPVTLPALSLFDYAAMAASLTVLLAIALASCWPRRARTQAQRLAQMPTAELLAHCRIGTDGEPNAYAREYMRRLEQAPPRT